MKKEWEEVKEKYNSISSDQRKLDEACYDIIDLKNHIKTLCNTNEKQEKKLQTAVEALEYIANSGHYIDEVAIKALDKIRGEQ